MCISPIRIRHPTNNNEFLDVPCGKCLECNRKRINDLTFRLIEQMKESVTAYFFTLTYDNDNLPYMLYDVLGYYLGKSRISSLPLCYNKIDDIKGDLSLRVKEILPCFNKPDVQQLIQALRDDYRRYLKLKGYKKDEIKSKVSKIKYFITSEYGDTTLRPHYHGVIFGWPWKIDDFLKTIEKYWKFGFVSGSVANENRLYYCCKYSFKNSLFKPKNLDSRSERCFTLMSKGLGLGFLTDTMIQYIYNGDTGEINLEIKQNGKTKLLPRYYRNKIFVTDGQKLDLQNYWSKFDQYENCPESQEPYEWRLEYYTKQVEKVRRKFRKEIL